MLLAMITGHDCSNLMMITITILLLVLIAVTIIIAEITYTFSNFEKSFTWFPGLISVKIISSKEFGTHNKKSELPGDPWPPISCRPLHSSLAWRPGRCLRKGTNQGRLQSSGASFGLLFRSVSLLCHTGFSSTTCRTFGKCM